MDNRKKWLIIGGVIGLLIVVLLVAVIYKIIQNGSDTTTNTNTNPGGGALNTDPNSGGNGTNNGNNGSGTNKPTIDEKTRFAYLVDDGMVATAGLSKDGYQLRYIRKETTGEYSLFSIDFNGETKTKLQSINITELNEAIWSPNRSKIIIKDKGSYKIYNFENQLVYNIDTNITSLDWIDDNRFTYKYTKDKEGHIGIAKALASGEWEKQKILSIEAPTLLLATIFSKNQITFFQSPNGMRQADIKVVNTDGSSSKHLISGRSGAEVKWAPDGKKGVFSATKYHEADSISLYIANSDGTNIKDTKISSFIRKAFWGRSSKVLFIAIPEKIPTDTILPNDYYDRKFTTQDTLWALNTDTLQTSILASSTDIGGQLEAKEMFASLDEKYLFVVTKDGKLARVLTEGAIPATPTEPTTPVDPTPTPNPGDETPNTGQGNTIFLVSFLAGFGAVILYLSYKFNLKKQLALVTPNNLLEKIMPTDEPTEPENEFEDQPMNPMPEEPPSIINPIINNHDNNHINSTPTSEDDYNDPEFREKLRKFLKKD